MDVEFESDGLVDPVIDATPIFTNPTTQVEMTTPVLWAFMNDMARKISDYNAIAARYGFTDPGEMITWIVGRPGVRQKIKELKAVFWSADNVSNRIRELSGHAVLEAMPDTASIMFDPTVAPAARIEALRAHARMAGMDGPGSREIQTFSNAADAPGRFSVQIVFQGAGTTETFSVEAPTKTIEGEVVS